MLTVRPASLNWALDHAINFGDTTMFPLPFEYEAIRHDWANVRGYLEKQDVLHWNVRPHRTMLSPKGRLGFRVITQLDPFDFLIYAALVREIASDVEAIRLPKDTVFSFRADIKGDGQLFDPTIRFDNFRERSREILDGHEEISHVVVTDIADFYPRVYSHRLQGALNSATNKSSHVSAIMRLLSGWNGTESFGIPVGNAPSRLLAEISITDVDDALLANCVRFIRFTDDYRLFATSYSGAYRHLAFLADTLYRNHGLTLQPQKTFIVEVDEFRKRFIPGPEEKEIDSLGDRFNDLLNSIGLSDPYGEIDYDDLSPEQKEIVGSLNLSEIFDEELTNDDPDLGLVRFVLRRMGQLGDDSLVDRALAGLDKLHPAFTQIIEYLKNIRGASAQRKAEIGTRVLNLLSDSLISELDYHRMWALDLFTHSTEWDNEGRFFVLLGNSRDQLSRRKLILALGRARQRHWFQSHWRNLFEEPPWPRRALLAAASCMPADERGHWFKSVEPRLDELEKAVMRWAKDNPF